MEGRMEGWMDVDPTPRQSHSEEREVDFDDEKHPFAVDNFKERIVKQKTANSKHNMIMADRCIIPVHHNQPTSYGYDNLTF